MQQFTQSDAPNAVTPNMTSPMQRPDRPCDACRRRKSRCVINPENAASCVMCTFHNRPCTFVEEAAPRKRRARSQSDDDGGQRSRRTKDTSSKHPRRPSEASNNTPSVVEDYANLQGESLLKKTLGLQNHRFATYIGLTDRHDRTLLNLRPFDDPRGESPAQSGSFRRVATNLFFHQQSDQTQSHDGQDFDDVDEIEHAVAPHGEALIRLYFRIVHPSFPILHKKVYLEKYGRSHREFSPPLLAAVYITALNWWSYSSELAKQTKPDVHALQGLALRTLHGLSNRAKLSTVQAGLLLLQQPALGSWSLTCLVTSIAEDLGLHLDCSGWRIPSWERGLRKRIAWGVFMQDKWSALAYGRPSHINDLNWDVKPVSSSDFPESAADEDDEDGSTEVEKGRTIFSAMISLTRMLSDIIQNVCSLKAEAEVAQAYNGLEIVLSQAKPIQLRLRSWYAEIPAALRVDAPSKLGKLNSVGYLHLAYFATEMSIHRRVISSLSHNTDPYLIEVCRSAARTRLVSAMEFFDRLKPEHLQSFWYFASTFNLALMGTFAGLCLATSLSRDEMVFYHTKLQEFKWTLRVRSKGQEFLEKANDMLASAVEPLLRPIDEVMNQTLSFPMMQPDVEHSPDETYMQPLDQFLDEISPEYMFSGITT